MGFTERQANSAIRKYKNVQPALDALLVGEFKETLDDVFYSDEEEDFVKRVKVPQPPAKDVKMNPKNPEGLTSLWVGNVLPEVTEKMLSQLFSKQGHVTSVRLLKEKYCAFVNYADKGAAGRAMEILQGHDLCGQKLLIKFPDNPIVNGTQNVIFRKPKPPVIKSNGACNDTIHYLFPYLKITGRGDVKDTTATKQNGVTGNGPSTVSSSSSQVQNPSQVQANGSKLKGPVNGGECYFWRTTGCLFGDSCKHKHIPSHKGIDRKPWQK
ncbi:hypothetical protein SK128_014514 [Halocaridina rubra]|uniref:Uncharacterized protein n=1 Tax=Halocaridina rubra TaxID=373956 RepID=A0AAN8ZUY3_HALRR